MANDELPTNQPGKKLPELSEIKTFGSVEVIPVTNATKFEIKMHQQLIKNTVEITPVLPDPSFNTPPEKITYSPSKESNDLTKCSSEATKSSVIKLDQNVSMLEQCVDIAKMCDDQMVNKDTNEEIGTNNKENNMDFQTTDRPANAQVFASKCFEKQMNSNENTAKHINKSVIEAETKNKPTNSVSPQKVAIDNLIANHPQEMENLESDENIANEKDLTDELFGNFPLPQTLNESNPNTLSPTAAFLLSFPVVSTASSSKPTESEITCSDEKQNQSKDHNLFESISSILNDLNEVPDGDKTNEPSNDIHFSYCSSEGKMNSCAVVGSQSTHSNHLGKNKAKSNDLESVSKAMAENNGSKNENSRMLKEQFLDIGKSDVSKIMKNGTKRQSSAEISPSLSFPHQLTSNKSAPKSTLPITSHSNKNHSDFYESLSTLGLPTKSTLASPSTNNTVSSHFNFQISSLTQPRNIIESRALIADPPFTFSLTKSIETVTTTSSFVQTQPTSRMNKNSKKLSPAKQTTNDRFCIPSTDTKTTATNRNNTYNPFSFDNPPVLSTSSSMSLPNFNNACSAASMSTPFTFTLTPTFSTVPANAPLLSNTDPLYSSSVDMPLLSVATVASKHLKKDRSHLELTSEKITAASNRNVKHFTAPNHIKPVKNHVNWMTSCMNKPVSDSSSEFGLISHTSSIDDHSAWSDPHRTIVDNAHFITTPALPMLQGDLALNTISNNVCSNVPKLEIEIRKPHSKAISPIKAQSKQSINRKVDYSSAGNKFNRNEKNSLPQPPANQSVRSNENHSTNNFHSVSQLLDQDRQSTNKMNYFNVIDNKHQSKDLSFDAKQKFNSKYDENNSSNHQFNDKFALHSSGLANNVVSNDCDRELFGGYFFSQSKRLKLGYSSSDYTSGNQSGANNYDNSFSNANDIHPPYTNYQTYENEFNTGNNSCMNQTYPYQYGQTQTYQSHQQYHTSHMIQNSTESIDPIILPQNFFQTPATLSNYKPPNFTEMVRTNTKPNTIPQSHSNHSKASNPASSTIDLKSMLPPTTAVHINDIHPSHPCPPSAISSNSLNKSPCKNVNNPTKSMHFTSHSNSFNNLNNLALNQSWNDSFSWIPYPNSIEKPYNCNLFNNNENSTKTFNSNNINNTNNTIPNFNLTTIFPDCNKS